MESDSVPPLGDVGPFFDDELLTTEGEGSCSGFAGDKLSDPVKGDSAVGSDVAVGHDQMAWGTTTGPPGRGVMARHTLAAVQG